MMNKSAMRRTNSNNFGLPPPAMDNSRHHTDGLGQSSTTTSSGGGGGASRRRARKQAEMSDIEFQKLQAFLERTGFDCGEAATRRAQRRTTPTSSKDSSPFGDVLDHYPFHHSFDGLNTSKSSFASSREESIMSAPVRTSKPIVSSSNVMSTPRTTNGRRYSMRNSPTPPINGQIIGSMMLPDPKPTDFPGVNLTPPKPLNATAHPATTSKKKKKSKSKKKKMKRRSSAPELTMQAAARLAALELEDEDDSGHNYQPKPRKKDDFDDFFAARRSSKTAMDLFDDVQRGRDEHHQAEQDEEEEEERRRTEFSSSLHNPHPSLLMTPQNGRDPRHKSLSPEATLNPLWSASSSSKKNVRRRRHSLTHQTSLPVDYERSDSGMLLGTKSIDYSERTSATSVMTGSSASPAVRRRSFAQIAPPISIHVSDSSSSSPVSPPTPPASKFGMGGGGGGPGGGGSSLSPEQQISQYHGQMLRSFLQQKGQDAQNASSVAAAFETFLKNQKDIVEQLAGTTSASMSPSNGDNGGGGWEGESNLRSPAAAAAVPHSPAPQYDEKERMVLDMLYEHQQKRQQQQQAQQQPAPPTPQQQQQQQHHPHQPQKRRSSRTPAWNRHGTIAHYEKSSRAIDSGFGDMRRNESFVRRKSKDQLFISEEDQQELARLAGE